MGLLVLLENFLDLFRGSLWLHLVNGSSSVTQGDIRIGTKWNQVQRLHVSNGLVVWKRNQTLCWAFSRMAGCRAVQHRNLSFPGSLHRALRQVLGRRESSQADTLLALLIREGVSTSEHRNGLCAVVPVSHAYLGATASDLGSVGECVH